MGGCFGGVRHCLFTLQRSEVLAKGKDVHHEVNGLRRGKVAFFRDNEQAESRAYKPKTVELRFRGSNGDKGEREPS